MGRCESCPFRKTEEAIGHEILNHCATANEGARQRHFRAAWANEGTPETAARNEDVLGSCKGQRKRFVLQENPSCLAATGAPLVFECARAAIGAAARALGSSRKGSCPADATGHLGLFVCPLAALLVAPVLKALGATINGGDKTAHRRGCTTRLGERPRIRLPSAFSGVRSPARAREILDSGMGAGRSRCSKRPHRMPLASCLASAKLSPSTSPPIPTNTRQSDLVARVVVSQPSKKK
eukprot:scaffold630_cov218-Pinguiococcus_pyrenoidosus.AAC.9